MNLEKVVFGFFITLAAALNFGFGRVLSTA